MRKLLLFVLVILSIAVFLATIQPSYMLQTAPNLALPSAPYPPPPAPPPPPIPQAFDSEPMGGGATKTDAILEQLESASMVFTVPDHANIKDTITVQLLIDPSKSLDEITEIVTVNGVRTTKRVHVSKIIEANLTAPNFKIDAVTPEQQAITSTQPTEWLWKLTPQSAGAHEVSLSVIAIVDVGDKSAMHHIKTYEQNVVIEIKTTQLIADWFKKYWQWLFSTLIIPLVIWFYKNKFKKS